MTPTDGYPAPPRGAVTGRNEVLTVDAIKQTMQAGNDICRLDYLVGTLATAYKGTMTSLVAKDFCMSDDGMRTTFKGRVLSVPAGNFEASLIRGGVELARVPLLDGSFACSADDGRIAVARDLQIDIIQSGRHIGTFLLKKESAGGVFISAVELSAEVAGMDLTRLTLPLRGKIGLLRKAEEIIYKVLSPKKEWEAFSEKLYDFSVDLFWSAPEVFYGAYDILAHFIMMAAERSDSRFTHKPVSNFLDLAGLPLAKESDPGRLGHAAGIWLHTFARSTVDFASQVQRATALLRDLHKTLPEADVHGAARTLIGSLKARRPSEAYWNSRMLSPFDTALSPNDVELLARFGEPGYRRREQTLNEAEVNLERGELDAALAHLSSVDPELQDDSKAAAALMDCAEKGFSIGSATAFIEIITAFVSRSDLTSRARDTLKLRIPGSIESMISAAGADACRTFLGRLRSAGTPLWEQVLLAPRTARAVLRSGDKDLLGQYKNAVKDVRIPFARVQGISPDTWAEIVDPLHLERLSAFLDLLGEGGDRLEEVLLTVIANLAVGGVLIPDDRLFQRRISAYLNSSALGGRFLLNFLLLERLPVFFNEVGASSRIRDYSTEIDSWGNDPVIYFVRKQVHVNASSYNVLLLERVIRSWTANDPSPLTGAVPADVLAQLDKRLLERYGGVIRPFVVAEGVQDGEGLHPERLLAVPDERIDGLLRGAGDIEASRKAALLIKLYKEIVKKYSLVERNTQNNDVPGRLKEVLLSLTRLKSIVQAPNKTEPRESLYFKRHIAFGIPSVLGTYHEPKFDALSDMLRLGGEVPALLERAISSLEDKGEAAERDVRQGLSALTSAWEVLKVFGLRNVMIDEFVDVLDHNRLDPDQVADVLRMWQRELAWAVSSLGRSFQGPIAEVTGALRQEELPEHFAALKANAPSFAGKAEDIVMRDILSGIPGLTESDRLLETLVKALHSREGSGHIDAGPAHPVEEAHDWYDIHALSSAEARRLAPDLGSKAKNLVYLKDRGLPVPAGAVLTARFMRDHRQAANHSLPAALHQAVAAVESRTGATFGGIERPLFLSVRSGSYISMPGILTSILSCGMNELTVEAFIRSTGDPGLGWDLYRKFIEQYGMSVYGLEREFFENIVRGYQRTRDPGPRETRDAAQARAIAGLYQEGLRGIHRTVPDDVFEQLLQCVLAVSRSWESGRAGQFRSATGTSAAWGTSVLLMEMVFGSQPGGGASMFFTRDPASLEPAVYGETREQAGGDDLASGRLSNRPLSRVQRSAHLPSLEECDPGLFRLHEDLARAIEAAFDGLPQEVEATYTRRADGHPRFFVLQSRRMEQGETSFAIFDEICRMESRVIGRGVGGGGGALSGVASFAVTPDQAGLLEQRTGRPVILLRKAADTDDVSLMPVVKGLVTATGGVTSHAAVLAQKFGLAAVVACADMRIETGHDGRPHAVIGGTLVREGTEISIDGGTGLVFSGACLQTTEKGGRS